MKFTLRFAFVFVLTFCFMPGARGQWVESTGPSLVVSMAATGNSIFAGTTQGIYLSTNNGSTWNPVGLDTDLITSITIFGTAVFAGTDGSGLYASKDNGATWAYDTTGLNGATTINCIQIDSADLITSTDSGIFVSTDTGGRWVQKLSASYASALVVEGTNVFTIGTTSKEFYASSDRGMNWTPVGPWPGFTYSMAALGGYIFAAEGGGQDVVRSSDGGAHWEQAGTGLPHLGPSFNCHYLFVYGQNLFVATDGGIFLSADIGTTWINITDTVTEPENGGPLFVNTLLAWNGNLWAGVVDSLWVSPLSKIMGLNSVNNTQTVSGQFTAYPNPLTQSTTIDLTLSESGMGEIYVVNLLGQEVTRIYDDELAVGNHSFAWNAGSLPPGMYECVVKMNGHVQQLPMVLQ